MPNRRTPPIEIPLPMGGVVTGTTHGDQPEGTTPDAMNVRAWDGRDRMGLGKRSGTIKTFESAAGTADAPRITGLSVLNEAQGVAEYADMTSEEFTEDWSGVTPGSPTDLGEKWVVYRHGGGGFTWINGHTDYEVDSGGLLHLRTVTNSQRGIGLGCAYFVDQADGIEVVIVGNRQAATASAGYNDGGATNIGPALAQDIAFRTGVTAYMVATGTNTIQCRIVEHDATADSSSNLASTADLTLDGTNTETEYTIRLTNRGGELEARFLANGVLSGGGNLDVTLTATTSLTGNRGGVRLRLVTTVSGSTLRTRTIKSVKATRLIPKEIATYAVFDPSLPNPHNSNRYYLPSAFRGITRASSGTLTITNPGETSSTSPNWPSIDDVEDRGTGLGYYWGTAGVIRLIQYVGDTSDRPGLETTGNLTTLAAEAADSLAGGKFMAGPVFRVAPDGSAGLKVGYSATKVPSSGGTGMVHITGYQMHQYTSSGASTMTTLGWGHGTSGGPQALIHRTHKIRWTDDGTNIRMYCNGMLLGQYTPSADPNYMSELDNYNGIGFAASRGGNINGNANTGYWGTVKIVQGENEGPVDITDFKPKILVLGDSVAHVGDIEESTLTLVGGTTLKKALPQAISFNKKFYAVDGGSAEIIDPYTLTVLNWAGEVNRGALPTNCSLIALYRGRIVLARQETNPTLWFMSRVFDPLDWDFNAEPLETAPYAGTNATVGVPGDAIVALIPFADDYLIFGCPSTMWLMEGDPGFGGQVQLMTNESGIMGPRAWCFDDQGTLYYLGTSGLYRLPRGQFQPENVSGRKLSAQLDRVDASRTLVQLAWDSFRQHVYIFMTDTAGLGGDTHYAYDVQTQTFWPVKYPARYGPWAVANLRGNTDDLRQFLLGGNDGFLYRPMEGTFSDDGDPIESYVRLAPIEMDRGLQEAILTELRMHGDPSNGVVNWELHSAQTPADLAAIDITSATPRASGTVFGNGSGWQRSVRTRVRDGAVQLVLKQTSADTGWNMERIQAFVGAVGNRRI